MSRDGSERAKLMRSLLRPGSFLLATLVAVGLLLAGCSSSSPGTLATTTTNPSAAYLATAPVGAQPQWDDLNPLTDTIYVANGGTSYATGNTVSVINGRTCRAGDLAGCARRSPSVTIGRAPSALAVDPTTDTVNVTNGNTTVAVIDGATCNAAAGSGCRQRPPEVTVGRNPSSVAIDPANHTAYVTNAGGHDVSMKGRVMAEPETYTVRIHSEPGQDLWAEVLELPGVFAAGADMTELRESLTEAISLYLSEPGAEKRVELEDKPGTVTEQHVLVRSA